MTDDERDLLVSAYLDGAVDDDERARVDGDEGLRAEVERLRAVRAALAAPVPFDASTRDRHLAAAMAGLDASPRLVPPPPPPVASPAVVTPLPRRSSRWWRPAAAAALLGIVAVGAIVSTRSDDDDRSSTAPPETLLARTVDTVAAAEAQAVPDGSDASLEAPGAPAPDDDAAADVGGAAASTPAITIASADELTAYVADLLAVGDGAGPERACDRDIYGTVSIRRGDRYVTAVVAPEPPREVVALDATSCAELARAAAP